MADPAPLLSWFPSLEELDAYAYRRRADRGWEIDHIVPRASPPPTMDPQSVIVEIGEYE